MYYKYMGFNKNFFENRLLRCTQPEYFNDPFEGTINKQSLLDQLKNNNLDNRYDEVIKYYNTSEVTYKNIGIISLSKTSDNLLMWAHYSNEHRGIVIEFNNRHKQFREMIGSSKCIKPVTYTSKRADVSEYLKKNEFPPTPLLYKSKEWRYEKEVRIFIRKECVDKIAYKTIKKLTFRKPRNVVSILEDYWFMEISKCAITKIIVGYRADRLDVLITYVKNIILGNLDRTTKLSFMTLCKSEFKLREVDFAEVKRTDELFVLEGMNFIRMFLEFDTDIDNFRDPYQYNMNWDDEDLINKSLNHVSKSIEELLAESIMPQYLEKINELKL